MSPDRTVQRRAHSRYGNEIESEIGRSVTATRILRGIVIYLTVEVLTGLGSLALLLLKKYLNNVIYFCIHYTLWINFVAKTFSMPLFQRIFLLEI